jgi:hypothetical protein
MVRDGLTMVCLGDGEAASSGVGQLESKEAFV